MISPTPHCRIRISALLSVTEKFGQLLNKDLSKELIFQDVIELNNTRKIWNVSTDEQWLYCDWITTKRHVLRTCSHQISKIGLKKCAHLTLELALY